VIGFALSALLACLEAHMLNLVMLVWLSNTPPAAKPPLKGVEAVRAAFVHVGVASATEAARSCLPTQPKVCGPLLKSLEQYSMLAKGFSEMTSPQAQQLLQLDREISPQAPGEFTQRVIERFVSAPLELARFHVQNGNVAGARVIAQQVLEADPANPEARQLSGAVSGS
jgi:hypothetical protein